MKPPCPFVLIIMDGYANNPSPRGNAVFHARKPALDRLFTNHPTTELVTFGERVGLPDDQMGNSEVGHLNIGAGRVVEQELTRINRSVRNHSLGQTEALATLFTTVKAHPGAALHLVGLTSTGGVHSSIAHAQELVAEAVRSGVKNIFIHAITDGRDRPPTASIEDIEPFEKFLAEQRAKHQADARIVTIVGRYFAMDRDSRWERTEKAYRLFTAGQGEQFGSAMEALKTRLDQGAQDEFLEPIAITAPQGKRSGSISGGDAVLFFNFRADRMRQIVRGFLPEEPSFERTATPKLLALCTLTEYEANFPVQVLFPPFVIRKHLGNVIADAGYRQLRIAETEKYAHVTYFFNGGEETPLPGEDRILVPSPRDVPTYDHKPEMSALGVTDKLLEKLLVPAHEVTVVNFANCDMVGHTGSFEAAVKAVETVDGCVGRILEVLESLGGSAIITADHGNADQMIDYETGGPHTFHTKHPVPLALFGEQFRKAKLRPGGTLGDIAPTICALLGLPQPKEMTGVSLVG